MHLAARQQPFGLIPHNDKAQVGAVMVQGRQAPCSGYGRPMQWIPLISTIVGAVIATGSAMLLDRQRWKRERVDRETQARRALYGDYLASLSEARHACGNMARDPDMEPSMRRTTAREAFGPCIGLRYQMTISVPSRVVEASEDAFRRLRDLRDRVMEGVLATDPVYLEGRRTYDDALAVLRARMREDLRVGDDGTAP
ncbi:hypothetical protein AB0F45_33535 [Streptomyces achromogenes]|uniref:hypothetical protein n=1 Tax=Streptomyces achromogenes TaxID=67255 RepID=UPI0033C60448